MSLNDIRNLYSYTEWANARFLEAIGGLSEEQYARELVSSMPTIRDTMAHIVMAEWVWLRRWKGDTPTALPEWMHEPALATTTAELRAIEEERRAFLDTLGDDDLQRPLTYRKFNGDVFTDRLGDLLQHVANHSTYHRGQLTTMLRQVGAVPPSTDVTVYLRR
jgi:uncharacterized damage-inducible protein DinB